MEFCVIILTQPVLRLVCLCPASTRWASRRGCASARSSRSTCVCSRPPTSSCPRSPPTGSSSRTQTATTRPRWHSSNVCGISNMAAGWKCPWSLVDLPFSETFVTRCLGVIKINSDFSIVVFKNIYMCLWEICS